MAETLIGIAGRSAAVFAVVLIGFRILGKRHVASLSIVDLVMILLISNAVQNAMVGDDTSLLGGVVAALTLLAASYLFTLILTRWRKAEQLFEGTPTLLVHNGVPIESHLRRESITIGELERAMREHGIARMSEVKSAVIEADGTISIIRDDAREHRIESFRRRKA